MLRLSLKCEVNNFNLKWKSLQRCALELKSDLQVLHCKFRTPDLPGYFYAQMVDQLKVNLTRLPNHYFSFPASSLGVPPSSAHGASYRTSQHSKSQILPLVKYWWPSAATELWHLGRSWAWWRGGRSKAVVAKEDQSRKAKVSNLYEGVSHLERSSPSQENLPQISLQWLW